MPQETIHRLRTAVLSLAAKGRAWPLELKRSDQGEGSPLAMDIPMRKKETNKRSSAKNSRKDGFTFIRNSGL